jgi:hydroxyacyl-ACP dehydratase HTD2-like protein with hotdog domain
LNSTSRIKQLQSGDVLPKREHVTDITQQFMYNAALWNAHRIHFDYAYATEVEGYPGLVIAGPLMGDWLTQTINDWLGDDGHLVSFEYSNRRAAYVGDVLHSGGEVLSVDRETGNVVLELQVSSEAGEVVTPATAVVCFVD